MIASDATLYEGMMEEPRDRLRGILEELKAELDAAANPDVGSHAGNLETVLGADVATPVERSPKPEHAGARPLFRTAGRIVGFLTAALMAFRAFDGDWPPVHGPYGLWMSIQSFFWPALILAMPVGLLGAKLGRFVGDVFGRMIDGTAPGDP